MSEVLRLKIASIIRKDLAEEAAAGFPLVSRLPDSETGGVPEAFLSLNAPDREALLDALAHYSTLTWSHEVVREKQAHPILGRYLRRGHKMGPGDPYGRERPGKSLMRKCVVDTLVDAGFTRQKGRADFLQFGQAHGPSGMSVSVDLAPGLLRQLDYGVRNWMHLALVERLVPSGPRDFVPIILNLSYENLWAGHGTSNPVCWDLMTKSTVEKSIGLLPDILHRLLALAERINALAGSELAVPIVQA